MFQDQGPPNAAVPSHHGCPHAPSLAGGPGTLRDAHSRGLPPGKGRSPGRGWGSDTSLLSIPSQLGENTFQALKKREDS